MSKKKDCYGLTPEEFTCRTQDCPYVAGCIMVMEKRETSKRIPSNLVRSNNYLPRSAYSNKRILTEETGLASKVSH